MKEDLKDMDIQSDKNIQNDEIEIPDYSAQKAALSPSTEEETLVVTTTNTLRRSSRQIKERFPSSTIRDLETQSSDEDDQPISKRKNRVRSGESRKPNKEDSDPDVDLQEFDETKTEPSDVLEFESSSAEDSEDSKQNTTPSKSNGNASVNMKNEEHIIYKQRVTRRKDDGTYEQVWVTASRAISTLPKKGWSVKRNFKCFVCLKDLKTKERHLRHMDDIHLKIQDGKKQYICPTCSKGFPTIMLFTKHLRRSHISHEERQERPVVKKEKLRQKKKKQYTMVTCKICNKELRIHAVQQHEDFHERNSRDPTKPFQCPTCNIFFKKERLKIHMTLHLKNNPYVCKFAGCGKKFDGSHSLQKHVALHMTERVPLPCSHCPATFSIQKYLRRHTRKYHPNSDDDDSKSKISKTKIIRLRNNFTKYSVQPVVKPKSFNGESCNKSKSKKTRGLRKKKPSRSVVNQRSTSSDSDPYDGTEIGENYGISDSQFSNDIDSASETESLHLDTKIIKMEELDIPMDSGHEDEGNVVDSEFGHGQTHSPVSSDKNIKNNELPPDHDHSAKETVLSPKEQIPAMTTTSFRRSGRQIKERFPSSTIRDLARQSSDEDDEPSSRKKARRSRKSCSVKTISHDVKKKPNVTRSGSETHRTAIEVGTTSNSRKTSRAETNLITAKSLTNVQIQVKQSKSTLLIGTETMKQMPIPNMEIISLNDDKASDTMYTNTASAQEKNSSQMDKNKLFENNFTLAPMNPMPPVIPIPIIMGGPMRFSDNHPTEFKNEPELLQNFKADNESEIEQETEDAILGF